MLKNNSGETVNVEMIDQYGGNFSSPIDAGMSQNHSLMEDSNVVINGNTVHVVSTEDEGMEIVVAA